MIKAFFQLTLLVPLINLSAFAEGPTVSAMSCPVIAPTVNLPIAGMSLPVSVRVTASNILDQAKQDAVTDCTKRLSQLSCTIASTDARTKCEATQPCYYLSEDAMEDVKCSANFCILEEVPDDGAELIIHKAWYDSTGASVRAPERWERSLLSGGYHLNDWIGKYTYTRTFPPERWHIKGEKATCSATGEKKCRQQCSAESSAVVEPLLE